MGLTFKENCADIRNSGIKKVILGLKKYKCNLDLYDPWANKKEIKKIYGISSILNPSLDTYDGILIGVAHQKFKALGINKITNYCKKKNVIYDLKNLFNSDKVDLRL